MRAASDSEREPAAVRAAPADVGQDGMRAQVVLLQGDRILLARHSRASGAYWVLPGGSVEYGESPAQAAVREAREETGLDIEIDRLLFVDGPRADGRIVIKRPRYTYLARIVGGELRSVEEPEAERGEKGYLCGAAWMPLDLPEYDVPTQDTLQLVKRALGRP